MSHGIQVVAPYHKAEHDDAIEALYSDLAHCPTEEKLAFLTHRFIGRPYLEGAQGEGYSGRFDQNPLYRCDAFDCVTYVNMVLALLISRDSKEFRHHLLKIAYRDGVLSYEYRNHFMSVDWNKNNADWGLVSDITAKILDDEDSPIAQVTETLIDRPNWFLHRTLSTIKLLHTIPRAKADILLRELQGYSLSVKSEISRLPYLPLNRLFDHSAQAHEAIFAHIPHGAVIEIIRPNWDLTNEIGTHLDVSHLGFAIWQDDQLLFRHASSINKYVIEVPLITYLQERLESPTIKGINVQRVLLP